jgi:hypothetical protein
MRQHFVIAFGGSGARSIEALTYLAASNCISSSLHILIVDPDETNGNVSEALRQLRRYQSVQSTVTRLASSPDTNAFFSIPINRGLPPSSFLWTNPQPNTEFQTLLQYSTQSPEEQQLLQLLYDEGDMALTFEKGYVGRAHVGSLDLLRNLTARMKEAASDDEAASQGSVDSLQAFFDHCAQRRNSPTEQSCW